MKSSKLLLGVAAMAISGCAGYATSQVLQPHMENALSCIRTARSELSVAVANKGGHRVRAMNMLNGAEAEVLAGIAAGSGY